MAVYRPTWRDKKTGELRTSKVWWFEFILAGKRVRQSAKTTRKTVALEAERNRRLELEKTLAGMPVEKRENRINTVADVVAPYLEHYAVSHRPKSYLFAKDRLAHVVRLLGNTLLPDLTEHVIRRYMKTRQEEGASGRTINTEVGELSRAVGRPWSVLWPKVRKMEERHDVGRALSPGEEASILKASAEVRSPNLRTLVRLALLTGMRSGELTNLTWGQIDFDNRLLTVGRAKSEAGTGRTIPMNNDLFQQLAAHAEWFTGRFGEARPEQYVFPFGSPRPSDPARPTTELKTGWTATRKAAGVDCRWHDLRHTACTKMAEAGVPEETMKAIMGHMSRKMLERYSHIRMEAKRKAVEALSLSRETAKTEPVSDGVPKESPKVGGVLPIQ